MTPILVPTLDELAVEFERCAAIYRAADVASRAEPDSLERDVTADAACSVMVTICEQIAGLPAQTMAHVRLKARALDWYEFLDGKEPTSPDARLAYQLVRAILDGVPGEGS
jgi:hypothetical protein